MQPVRLAGTATATWPTIHRTIIAAGITYQAMGVGENASTMAMLSATARMPPTMMPIWRVRRLTLKLACLRLHSAGLISSVCIMPKSS